MGIKIVNNNPPKKSKGVMPQTKNINTKKISPEKEIQRGQIWGRPVTIKENNKQVVRREEIIIVSLKSNFVSFVAKAAFDHDDICNTWTMKLDAFKKTFSR